MKIGGGWINSVIEAGLNLPEEAQRRDFNSTWAEIIPDILSGRFLAVSDISLRDEMFFSLVPLSSKEKLIVLCKLRSYLSRLESPSLKISPLIMDQISEVVTLSTQVDEDLSQSGILNLISVTISNEGAILAVWWLGFLENLRREEIGNPRVEEFYLMGLFNMAKSCYSIGDINMFDRCFSEVEKLKRLTQTKFSIKIFAMFCSDACGYYANDSNFGGLDAILEKVDELSVENFDDDEIWSRITTSYYNGFNAQWKSSSRKSSLLGKLLAVAEKVPFDSKSQHVVIWALTGPVDRITFLKSTESKRLKKIVTDNSRDNTIVNALIEVEINWLLEDSGEGEQVGVNEHEFSEEVFIRLRDWINFEDPKIVRYVQDLIARCVAGRKE